MVLLFSLGIDRQGPLFTWYPVQQKDPYQLQLIISYGGYVGVNEDQIRQHNDERRISHQSSKRNDAINGRLSRQWSPFSLARAVFDPPTSLCKKLFPAIDEWLDRLAAKELSSDKNDPIQPTIAANAFLQVIMILRKTFMQGSVLMLELHPLCHSI
ncbi:hypothetical protein [Absidia glauca]|uniref:Ndc10 domain-containing protein n=1 Tax=Absidia glauca TaxID=4829 RepID=A0A163M0U8_ABSGL|nr:hypothetical protein [Absidia glauca]